MTISQQEREEWRARHFSTAEPLYWGIVGVADRFLDALEETEEERDRLIERVKLAEARVKEAERKGQVIKTLELRLRAADRLATQVEILESRLRAAEEVVEAARRFRHPKPYDACPICVALSHYDEAVTE